MKSLGHPHAQLHPLPDIQGHPIQGISPMTETAWVTPGDTDRRAFQLSLRNINK